MTAAALQIRTGEAAGLLFFQSEGGTTEGWHALSEVEKHRWIRDTPLGFFVRAYEPKAAA